MKRTVGLTIVELLVAIVVFTIAVLALSAGIIENFRGIRKEGRITVANQVAVTVHEELRDTISSNPSPYDSGVSNQSFSPVTVAGVTHTGTYSVAPYHIDGSGSLIAAAGTAPHVFEVTVTITIPENTPRTYTTLVRRKPTP